MVKLENKGFGQFWVTRNTVTYVVGLSEAARLLKCSIEEARKIAYAILQDVEVA
ncbi:hypothetical protein [Exiguobacterium sp. A1_3_1]|uniref:hypothetical protein n=1 Tax=Exiguobacterium sp. A1_3_1 TaxID=2651871 RepID=UPI003B97FDD0